MLVKASEERLDALARRGHTQAQLEHTVQHRIARSIHAQSEHATVPRRSRLHPDTRNVVVKAPEGGAFDGLRNVLELFHGEGRYGR